MNVNASAHADVVSLLPFAAALADQVKDPQSANQSTTWECSNADQRYLTEHVLGAYRAAQYRFTEGEVDTVASNSPAEINELYKRNNLTLEMPKFIRPDEFGIAAIQKVAFDFMPPGKEVTLEVDSVSYPAGLQDTGARFFTSPHHNHPIAKLEGMSFYMAPLIKETWDPEGEERLDFRSQLYVTAVDQPLSGFDLYRFADTLASSLEKTSGYSALRHPMVECRVQPKLTPLANLRLKRGKQDDLVIDNFMQENHLQLNHEGIRIVSGSGATAYTACGPGSQELVIDQQFILWSMDARFTIPLAVAFLPPLVWKNPGPLVSSAPTSVAEKV